MQLSPRRLCGCVIIDVMLSWKYCVQVSAACLADPFRTVKEVNPTSLEGVLGSYDEKLPLLDQLFENL